jgi:hypothetical protein
MNKRSWFQCCLFKFGFILFICIPQSQTFTFSLFDFKRLPFRNNIELVRNLKPDHKDNILDYLSYKQYLSDLFSSEAEILENQFYCKEFVNLFNEKINVRLFHSRNLFDNEISPFLNKNISLKFYHLFKTEMLTYSA